MLDSECGKIRNRNFARQLRDFSGLRWGKITPTDIDGFVDFQDKIFVFIETKFNGREMSTGQRMALERLCDACAAGGKHSIVLIASHANEDAENTDIDVANLPVVQFRTNGKWGTPKEAIVVRQAIDKFKDFVNRTPL